MASENRGTPFWGSVKKDDKAFWEIIRGTFSDIPIWGSGRLGFGLGVCWGRKRLSSEVSVGMFLILTVLNREYSTPYSHPYYGLLV